MMRMMKASWLCLLFLSVGCSGKLDQNEYVNWIRDYANGLHASATSNEYAFDLQYTPTDYVWLQYQGRSREELKSIQYYTLIIEPNNSADADLIDYNTFDEREKQQKLYYFSYTFQDNIKLQEDGKTLPCVLYHFEKTLDLKKGRTFILGFENLNPLAKEAKLVIESDLLGPAPVSITVSKMDIPTLDI